MVDGCGNHYGEQIYRLNVGRHSSLPSLISIRNLAYSILKKLGDDIVKDIEFTELEKCPQCDKDILSVLSCAHVFHRGVMKKYCFIKTIVPSDNLATQAQDAAPPAGSVTSLQSTMDVDEVDVDPASIEHPKRTKEPGTTCPAR
ncbi:uncharacterized protein OCT59_018499 [Rhizophagus irregularis]|uniref:uncharacterized protein n=1 Tax=Rhizophagus irregularis TaxID=588596 RepID=UPI003333E352|nr:hypothetical protein OCT59_018499 [Rhizophagus irregularis]